MNTDAIVCEDNGGFLPSASQGRSPIPDRPGCGGRGVLPGSGGRHHRAYSPLHPGGCSQYLQRHADEPQLGRPHTRAAQLANPPAQVGDGVKQTAGIRSRHHRHLSVPSGLLQNPPRPS